MIAATGQPLKSIEHGVYRSLRIKGLITHARNGYALTEMGEDMVKVLSGWRAAK